MMLSEYENKVRQFYRMMPNEARVVVELLPLPDKEELRRMTEAELLSGIQHGFIGTYEIEDRYGCQYIENEDERNQIKHHLTRVDLLQGELSRREWEKSANRRSGKCAYCGVPQEPGRSKCRYCGAPMEVDK